MFKELQLADADEYVFCFYPETSENVDLVNEKFMVYAKQELVDCEKVKIELMRNSKLSPVNNSAK